MELIVGAVASRLAVRHYKRTRRELGHRCSFPPKMAFFDQVRGAIGKTVQKFSEHHVFHEFPEAAQLAHVDRLSIKLKDPQLHDMINTWNADRQFNTITFLIRDEAQHKKTLFEVDMDSGKGLTLKNSQGKTIMVIKLPNNDPTALGKLMHPAPATLFKVLPSPSPVGMNYTVQQSSDKRTVLHVEKAPVSLYQIGKAAGIINNNCVYWMKSVDGTVLGYVRPKLVLKSNTLVVKFMSANRDPQVRATILGAAILLFISECYPPLRAMLQESIRRAEGF